MKISIIGAMEQEVAILKSMIDGIQTQQLAGCTFYTGTLNGADIVLLQSGIGKVSAAIGTTILLDHFAPDVVINTGSAGGFDRSLTMGDVVISNEVRHHDADVTAFGYEIGQMAGQPAAYQADERLIEIAEKALSALGDTHAVRGLICSGDAFIATKEQVDTIRTNFPTIVAAEMEASAVAQVCEQFKVPFVIVRAISDVVEKESPMDFNEFLPLAAKSSSEMAVKMVELLNA